MIIVQQPWGIILNFAFLQTVIFPAINLCAAVVGFTIPIVHRVRYKEWARGGATEWLLLPTLYSFVVYTLYFAGVIANTADFLRSVFVFFLLSPAVPSALYHWEKICRQKSNQP